MNLTRISTIFLRQFYLFRRSKYRVFGLFYWTTLDLILWGVLTLYLSHVGGGKLNFITFLLSSIIFWNFLTRMQHGISISYLEDVWVRNFMNLFASPLTITEYLAGLMLTGLFTTFTSIAFMVILAWFLFAYNIFQFGFLMIPFIAVLFLFGLALGILTTGIVMRLGPSSEILAWSVPALLTPLAGVFYPIASLPHFLQPVASILPPAYVFEGMRSIVITGSFNASHLLIAFLLSLVYFILAYLFFIFTYRFVLREGHFTKFFSE